jgi:hypothetical protein
MQRKEMSIMTDDARTSMHLERQLRSLGGRDDLFPTTPKIADGVNEMIRSQGATGGSSREPRRVGWRSIAIVALVVLAAVVASLAAPASRTAIAEFFGIEGIRIEFGQGDNVDVSDTPASIGGSLLLGERTTLDEVAATVTFDVMAPTGAVAGDPDETYLNQRSDVTVVGLLYEASDTLPEIGQTGVGMLLLQIDSAHADVTFVTKSVIGGGQLTTTMVNDGTGHWVENGILTVEPVQGLMFDEVGTESRRSGNVLIWSDGETTYRLESMLPMADAVRIAESLEPIEDGGNQ